MMKCADCGGSMKKSVASNYHYVESGLNNIYLSGFPLWTCTECGAIEPEIPSIEVLHREIARLLVSKKTRLSPTEFRFLRTYMGMSGRDFAKSVGVKPETVSRWENRKVEIPTAVDQLIRHKVLLDRKNHDYRVVDLIDSIENKRALGKVLFSRKRSGWSAKVA